MEQIEIIWLKIKLKEHKQWPPHMRIWKNICTYPHKSGIEGGEKTILQSNNMVALRVSLLYLGMVWYDNIKDDIRDDIYQRSTKYVHIPTAPPQVFG